MTASTVDLPIEGMSCAACAARIEKQLNRLDGVEAAVNFASESAKVSFDPVKTPPQTLVDTIAKTGFAVPRRQAELDIQGMTCAACAGRIEKVLNRRRACPPRSTSPARAPASITWPAWPTRRC